jgi:Cdc6-like AAA superfamily ATPase
MEDTRVRILEELEAWAHDGTASKVCWLNGHPGTGKTTIAHTLCERLEKQRKLGASFFCSRSALRDAARIIPTISVMLSQSIPKFRLAKNKILE